MASDARSDATRGAVLIEAPAVISSLRSKAGARERRQFPSSELCPEGIHGRQFEMVRRESVSKLDGLTGSAERDLLRHSMSPLHTAGTRNEQPMIPETAPRKSLAHAGLRRL